MSRKKIDSRQLGVQLRTMRQKAKLTLREVSTELNVAIVTVRGWESGKRTPILMDLDAYLKVVGCTMILGVKPNEIN